MLNGNYFVSDKQLLNYTKNNLPEIFKFLSKWFSIEKTINIYTSGSTGTPKLIGLKKEHMINSARATGEFFNLSENTLALLCLSTDYIAGKMMVVRALVLGWKLDVIEVSSKIILKKVYDFVAMVPLQLRNSINYIEKIKKLIIGGGVVSFDILKQIKSLKTEIFLTYGMTETITHIAIKRLNNKHLSQGNNFYKVLPGIEIFIDYRNCLLIKAKQISNDFIITNDIVQLISDKEFDWIGRFDNVINSGGIKLYPERIEFKLTKTISNRFFIYGIYDDILGEKLILIIEGKQEKEKINFNDLTKYEKPKEIFFIDKFIQTKTKKINRKKTIEQILNKKRKDF